MSSRLLRAWLGALGIVTATWMGGCASPPQGGDPIQITIPSGASFRAVTDTLSARGLIRKPVAFRLWARFKGLDRGVRAGNYAFSPGTSWSDLLDDLVTGRVLTVAMTIPEGFMLAQMADRIAAITGDEPSSIRDYLQDPGAHERYDLPGPGLEGYLFPDTYRFAEGTPLNRVVQGMVDRYRAVWTAERRARLEELGMTEREVIALASIIQAEARVVSEMPTISAVYHNRLRDRWPLQADPTVLYALGGHRARLLFAAIDSVASNPYNTYRNPGLPPGAIGAPGELAIQAALHPLDVDYMFFVARPDGSHVFTRTLPEHNRAIAESRRLRALGGAPASPVPPSVPSGSPVPMDSAGVEP